MPQKVDRHLWVLRTFHIKTSRHSRWVKSRRPITAASSNHIASCSGITSIVELFICFGLYFFFDDPSSDKKFHGNTLCVSDTKCQNLRRIWSYFPWRIDQIPKYQHFCRLPWELFKYQNFSAEYKKLTFCLWVKSQHFPAPGIQPFHLRAFISHLIEHLTSHREYPRVKCIFLCSWAFHDLVMPFKDSEREEVVHVQTATPPILPHSNFEHISLYI